jgi:menaquinone reductase, multiheme cytochrome c subunit
MRRNILLFAGVLAGLGAGWAGFPRAIYTRQPEPVDFSHKVHADKAGANCVDCHGFRDDGSFAGIPTLDKCASCHAAPMGTTAAEKHFIDNYVTPGREPQWLSYARQPENVYFSHIRHVKGAQLKCVECHGNEGSADHLRPFEQDRVSGYSRDIWGAPGRPGMKMADCVDCHRRSAVKSGAREGGERSCLDCHK